MSSFDFILRRIKKLIKIIIASCYILIIAMLPSQWFRMNILDVDILPTFDIGVIYYLSTNYKLKYWHLFLLGIWFDYISFLPIGGTSMLILLLYYITNYLKKFLLFENYITNIVMFIPYAIIVTIGRYFIVKLQTTNFYDIKTLIFYLLVIISSYPLLYLALQKPLKIMGFKSKVDKLERDSYYSTSHENLI